MVNLMNSIIERIWFSGMVGRECIRFIYILFPAKISSFCGCQTDFSKCIIKPHRVKLILTNSVSYVQSLVKGVQNCRQ